MNYSYNFTVGKLLAPCGRLELPKPLSLTVFKTASRTYWDQTWHNITRFIFRIFEISCFNSFLFLICCMNLYVWLEMRESNPPYWCIRPGHLTDVLISIKN